MMHCLEIMTGLNPVICCKHMVRALFLLTLYVGSTLHMSGGKEAL